MASQKDKSAEFFEEDSDHGLAKRVILKKVLQGWTAYHLYCGRYSQIFYVDGFSGEGSYGRQLQDKETKVENFGSPVIALDCVLNCFQNITKSFQTQQEERGIAPQKVMDDPEIRGTKYGLKPPISVKLFCVEAEKKIREELEENMVKRRSLHDGYYDRRFLSVDWEIENCKFKDSKTIAGLGNRVRDNATFIFIDPFGYSHTPMDTVGHLIGNNRTLMITLMVRDMNRFKKVQPKVFDNIYGTKRWNKVFDMKDPTSRYNCFADVYMDCLKEKGAEYTFGFPVRNIKNHVVYYLIFASSGRESYEVLKKYKQALNKVSTETDELKYSGYTVRDEIVEWKNNQDLEAMATLIFKNFAGTTTELSVIERFIWLETPFIYQTKALKILELTGRITNVSRRDGRQGRPRGTYADASQLTLTFDTLREELDCEKITEPRDPVDIDDERLSGIIYEAFQGKTGVTLEDIKWMLLRFGNYKMKMKAIKHLEDENKLTCWPVGVRKRKGTYPEGCRLNFISSEDLAAREMMAANPADDDDQVEIIYKEFQGRNGVTLKDIESWLRTSGHPKLKKKDIKRLEDENKLTYVEPPAGVERSRWGTYPTGCLLNFTRMEEDGLDVEGEDGLDVEGEDGLDVEGEDGLDVEGEDGLDVEGEDGLDVEEEDDLDVEEVPHINFTANVLFVPVADREIVQTPSMEEAASQQL